MLETLYLPPGYFDLKIPIVTLLTTNIEQWFSYPDPLLPLLTYKMLSEPSRSNLRAGDVAQLVEPLLSKLKALGLLSSTTKKKKKAGCGGTQF